MNFNMNMSPGSGGMMNSMGGGMPNQNYNPMGFGANPMPMMYGSNMAYQQNMNRGMPANQGYPNNGFPNNGFPQQQQQQQNMAYNQKPF